MSRAVNLRKVTGLGRVGRLRGLARRRPRVDLSHPARSPLGSSVVNCVTYRDGRRLSVPGDVADAVKRVRESGEGFVWLGLHEPTSREFAGIAELFDLHPLAVEDAVEAHQRPKLERYGETLFAVLKTVRYVEHEELTATSEVVDTGEIMVFVGEDFVVTVRHGRHGSLGPLREGLEADPARLAQGPSAVLQPSRTRSSTTICGWSTRSRETWTGSRRRCSRSTAPGSTRAASTSSNVNCWS